MKKWIFFVAMMITVLTLSACGNDAEEESQDKSNDTETSATSEDTSEGTSSEADTDTSSLQLLENDDVGKYLADSDGMTLYYFTKDEEGKSNCSDKCLENWPAFTTQDFEVPEGFSKDDFGTIMREDTGEEQVTYKGYPLYYFVKDKEKGDVNGQGVKDVWYIVNSDTTFKK
ncbi:hypothetical protein [Virgibacillus halodenitrificans]|uniref:hypothetical protein n=1 Tax=Virgibacillus halodenitrificans TaxID=1482 RepID=UPI000313DBE1|nr:hypothetical protein [Virgibacillus halodenitrificans]